ncbi:TPA: hypothetical protein ACTNSM_004416 [Salmonella enterica subsp. enterica serovar Enteritidis]
MSDITKEEVKAFIDQIESDLANGWVAQVFELKLARIALASLEAEPAPVVPEERPSLNNGIVGFDEGWNACRAAMLQGSQPVSNRDELLYAQVKAVADLYALCWQSGEVVTYTPDPEKANIWLNNYSGTCIQEYVKLERHA